MSDEAEEEFENDREDWAHHEHTQRLAAEVSAQFDHYRTHLIAVGIKSSDPDVVRCAAMCIKFGDMKELLTKGKLS